MSILSSLRPPATWQRVPFGRVAERSKESGRPDLPPLSVFLGAGVVPRESREDNHNQLGEDLGKYLVVRPGDLVFNKLRTWQGGLGASRHEGIVSPAYFVCRPRVDYDSRFLQYLLLSDAYLQELTRVSKWQPPSQFDIGWEQLSAVPIFAPPLATQRAIADYLDTETARIDALITKKQRMIELLEQRFAVSCDDVVWDGAPTAPLRHFVSELTVGIVVQPASYYVEPGTVGAVPAVRAVDTKPYSIQANDLVWISAEGNALHRKSQLRSGDVVVVRTGNAGAACVVPTELEGANCISNVIVRCSDRLDPAFIEAVLNSARTREAIAAESVGAIQKHFGVDAAKQLLIPDLAIEEQRRRAAVLTARRTRLERTLAGIDHQIDLLRERRQALITAAVTGELEVPGVAA